MAQNTMLLLYGSFVLSAVTGLALTYRLPN